MVLELSLLTTGLPALGRLPPADAANSRLFPSHWCSAGHAIHPSLCSNINFLELFPIFISERRFGAVWTNKRVFVETENTQALLFINKGTCKNPIAMTYKWKLRYVKQFFPDGIYFGTSRVRRSWCWTGVAMENNCLIYKMLFIKETLLSTLSHARNFMWDKRQQQVTHTNTVKFF